ncbi:MAG: hypothetical protein ABI293_09835 [Rhodanobacter sp.]
MDRQRGSQKWLDAEHLTRRLETSIDPWPPVNPFPVATVTTHGEATAINRHLPLAIRSRLHPGPTPQLPVNDRTATGGGSTQRFETATRRLQEFMTSP